MLREIIAKKTKNEVPSSVDKFLLNCAGQNNLRLYYDKNRYCLLLSIASHINIYIYYYYVHVTRVMYKLACNTLQEATVTTFTTKCVQYICEFCKNIVRQVSVGVSPFFIQLQCHHIRLLNTIVHSALQREDYYYYYYYYYKQYFGRRFPDPKDASIYMQTTSGTTDDNIYYYQKTTSPKNMHIMYLNKQPRKLISSDGTVHIIRQHTWNVIMPKYKLVNTLKRKINKL